MNVPATLGPAWRAAANVRDPELPFLTIEDLGMLRSMRIEGERIIVGLASTYSGCPAQPVIEIMVAEALERSGYACRIERVRSPAWTTDWITDAGREALRANGISPPSGVAANACSLFSVPEAACPACGSPKTVRTSEFGSTACKALYLCQSCREPFEHFKRI